MPRCNGIGMDTASLLPATGGVISSGIIKPIISILVAALSLLSANRRLATFIHWDHTLFQIASHIGKSILQCFIQFKYVYASTFNMLTGYNSTAAPELLPGRQVRQICAGTSLKMMNERR